MKNNNLNGLLASLILVGGFVSIIPGNQVEEIPELKLNHYTEATLPKKIEAKRENYNSI